MIKKNIFCMENERISVIRHKGNRIEFVKKDGEIEFPIMVDFWVWWKEATAYVEGDEVDFCFIYDKEYSLLEDEFLLRVPKVPKEASVWGLNYIKSYFWELKPIYFNICLIGQNGQEYYLGGNKAEESSVKKFYTNLEFVQVFEPEPVEESSNDAEIKSVSEDEISPIAKYFIDLIRNERGL